jgi:hypothetical protein
VADKDLTPKSYNFARSYVFMPYLRVAQVSAVATASIGRASFSQACVRR